MYHPSPIAPFGSPASPPDAATLIAILLGMLIVLVVDIRCMKYCLDDLNRRAFMPPANRQMWTFIIILGGPVGQAAYWLYGRGPY